VVGTSSWLHPQLSVDLTSRGASIAQSLRDSRAATAGKGKHITNLINLQPDETVKASCR